MQYFLLHVSTNSLKSSVIAFPEHSNPTKLTLPNKPFIVFGLSLEIPSSCVSTCSLSSYVIVFPEHSIPTILTRPNKQFNVFRLPFAILSSGISTSSTHSIRHFPPTSPASVTGLYSFAFTDIVCERDAQ